MMLLNSNEYESIIHKYKLLRGRMGIAHPAFFVTRDRLNCKIFYPSNSVLFQHPCL